MTAADVNVYRCGWCGQTFDPERSDARHCSDACRAAAWRAITHRAHVHHPAGWQIPAHEWTPHPDRQQRCTHIEDGACCEQPARWRVAHCTNHTRNHPGIFYRCDEHIGADELEPCDSDAACHRHSPCPAHLALENEWTGHA